MHLWLADRIVRLNLEPKQFFRIAHVWRFGKDAHTEHDVLAYQVGGIIPQYVRDYVADIQQKEKDHAVQKCREQIEVGEACVPVQNGNHTAFYHIGCHTTEVKDQEDKKRILAHYEEQAMLARTVC